MEHLNEHHETLFARVFNVSNFLFAEHLFKHLSKCLPNVLSIAISRALLQVSNTLNFKVERCRPNFRSTLQLFKLWKWSVRLAGCLLVADWPLSYSNGGRELVLSPRSLRVYQRRFVGELVIESMLQSDFFHQTRPVRLVRGLGVKSFGFVWSHKKGLLTCYCKS